MTMGYQRYPKFQIEKQQQGSESGEQRYPDRKKEFTKIQIKRKQQNKRPRPCLLLPYELLQLASPTESTIGAERCSSGGAEREEGPLNCGGVGGQGLHRVASGMVSGEWTRSLAAGGLWWTMATDLFITVHAQWSPKPRRLRAWWSPGLVVLEQWD